MTDQIEDTGISEKLTITDLETLKVVADPLRLQILESFGDKPRTVKQVAKAMGLTPNKLYYHVNMLEERGLLRVVETRVVSGIIEKIYQITAHSISVDKALLTVSENRHENLALMVDSLFDNTRDKLMSSARAGILQLDEDADKPNRLYFSSWNLKLTDAQATALVDELADLLEKYVDEDEQGDTAADTPRHPYSFLHVFFKTVPSAQADDSADSAPPT